MGFWEGMKRVSEAVLGEQGETFQAGGDDKWGKVEPVQDESRVTDGGQRAVVSFDVFVTHAVSAEIEDGVIIEARGMRGRLNSRLDEGSQVRLIVGPENRWDGEVPGL